MKKIGLFYAPKGGSVEKVIKKVATKIGENNAELVFVENIDATEFEKYDKIIMGISTIGRDNWDQNYKKIGWDFFISKINNINLAGKTFAIVGLGNHLLYPDNFVDSMGLLAKQLKACNATIIGEVSIDEYDFENSGAVIGNKFVGLPIDEDNDSELTDGRLDKWLTSIKPEFGF